MVQTQVARDSREAKKAYVAPALTTHGDVRALTQHPGNGLAKGHDKNPGSQLF